MTYTKIQIGDIEFDATSVDFPSNRIFRDAWCIGETNIITVNMNAAREIWREKIRLARREPMAELDAQFMKALEAGLDTSDIAAKKQALRDAPQDPAIDAANTPEELRLVRPAGLVIE